MSFADFLLNQTFLIDTCSSLDCNKVNNWWVCVLGLSVQFHFSLQHVVIIPSGCKYQHKMPEFQFCKFSLAQFWDNENHMYFENRWFQGTNKWLFPSFFCLFKKRPHEVFRMHNEALPIKLQIIYILQNQTVTPIPCFYCRKISVRSRHGPATVIRPLNAHSRY